MEKIKLILDTDIGGDCDDAGAIAVMHNLANEGKVEILGCTVCTSEIAGAYAVKALNTCYGRPDIPIGRFTTRPFLEQASAKCFTAPVAKKYRETHDEENFERAVTLLRKLLSQNTDVTIVVIGMQNNIAELLKSQPDEYSELNGVELVKKSVKHLYCMGGDFKNLDHAECNIAEDIKASQYVAEHCPVPMIFNGFEIGESIYTGATLYDIDEDNPLKMCYRQWFVYRGEHVRLMRQSWDPITLYCAVNTDTDLVKKSEPCTISFVENGKARVTPGGKNHYLIQVKEDKDFVETLDKYIR